ncbi:Imm50 family immunity protein [Streptomyces sp. NPDC005574]|uniref:Imm50 family immunity protein n=1 Tax=Streptomyces sp. NPDC005574 TaxID=3156891 RepID=UPI0033B72532
MPADWTRLLASPEFLGPLYDGNPPPPEVCDLFYVHIDERAHSVTLGFDTRVFPSIPAPGWEEQGLNAFEFHLVFTGVERLRVTGWGAGEARSIDLSVTADGGLRVLLGTESSGVTFRAETLRMAKTRAYPASDIP